MWRTGPLQGHRNVVANGSVIHLTDEVTEEGDGLFVQVWLELGVEMDNEDQSLTKNVIRHYFHSYFLSIFDPTSSHSFPLPLSPYVYLSYVYPVMPYSRS